ncbi:MAG: glycoside hydrolase family protein [Alphaproteobacteria bacterium]|nr:glycoside hydrolase family protein [Alphaproteobacteria bacterium]
MSDTSSQSMKVSREGIVLIKSFEGFRPRAIRREDGGWMIGYGHTLSAREGASVSEADAELLLRYDLLPVEKAVNEITPSPLNQHQFDALVSFALSVGLDRFAGSDVRERLGAGAPGEAADAMIGWPEPALPETALRRRAAERALFTADPKGPVALSDLLAAPLPLPPAPPVVEPDSGEPETEADIPVQAAPAATDIDPRGAAVAVLLGESVPPVADAEAEAEPVVPEFTAAQPAEADPPSENPAVSAVPDADPQSDTAASLPAQPDPAQIATGPETSSDLAQQAAASSLLIARRFTPYGAAAIGPLAYLQPAGPTRSLAAEAAPSPVIVAPDIEDAPTSAMTEVADPASEQIAEASQVEVVAPGAPAAAVSQALGAALVLTPLEDGAEYVLGRPLWGPEQRSEPEAIDDASLFGEDLALTQGGGPILRHEIEAEAPARFDWSETGAFIIMGAVGLTSFGAAMAAFRLASEQSGGGDETTTIACVLAVIGFACVVVSSFNLYRRWGLPGAD